jgi:hypothetical protein
LSDNSVVASQTINEKPADIMGCEKCDIEIVRKTEKEIVSLTDELLKSFLCTFDKKCHLNIEYSEYSNEVLYKALLKQPQQVVRVLDSIYSSGNDLSVIYVEISSPLLDYSYDDLIMVIEKSEGSAGIKKKIITALKRAKKG